MCDLSTGTARSLLLLTSVHQVQASDADRAENAVLLYTLLDMLSNSSDLEEAGLTATSPNTTQLFSVDPVNGILRAVSDHVIAEDTYYQVTVECRDQAVRNTDRR